MSSKDKPKKTASPFKKIFVSPPGTIKFNKSSAHKSVPIKDPGFTPKKPPTILTEQQNQPFVKNYPIPQKVETQEKTRKRELNIQY